MSEEYKNWFGRLHHLHYIYVILMLMMTLVAFIAYYHCDKSDLVAQVGFAASISSIILSVLAIIVTVVSNGSMDKLAHGMYNLKNVPSEVKKSIDEAIQKITDTTDSLDQASKENKQGIIDMQTKFETLFHELEQHVADKLQESATNVENIKKIVTDMQTSTQSLAQSMKPSEKKDNDGHVLSDEIIVNLMDYNSLAGFALFYAIDKYLEKGVSGLFDLTKMNEFYQDNSYSQYFYGYLVLLYALKLCNYNQPSRDKQEFIFLGLDNKIREKYKDYMGKKDVEKRVLTQIDAYLEQLKTQEKNDNGEQK